MPIHIWNCEKRTVTSCGDEQMHALTLLVTPICHLMNGGKKDGFRCAKGNVSG